MRRRQAWEAGLGDGVDQAGPDSDPFATGFPAFEDYLAALFGERRPPRPEPVQSQEPPGPVTPAPAPPPPVQASSDLETVVPLTPDQARAWALAVGMSGGLALVSDDLALLDDDARRVLDEVVELGRRVDADAQRGVTPVCGDLLDRAGPSVLRAAGHVLRADPADPVPALTTN